MAEVLCRGPVLTSQNPKQWKRVIFQGAFNRWYSKTGWFFLDFRSTKRWVFFPCVNKYYVGCKQSYIGLELFFFLTFCIQNLTFLEPCDPGNWGNEFPGWGWHSFTLLIILSSISCPMNQGWHRHSGGRGTRVGGHGTFSQRCWPRNRVKSWDEWARDCRWAKVGTGDQDVLLAVGGAQSVACVRAHRSHSKSIHRRKGFFCEQEQKSSGALDYWRGRLQIQKKTSLLCARFGSHWNAS